MAGRVYIGERKIEKPSEQVDEGDALQIRGEDENWASRGAHKLERAIQAFRVDANGLVAADIGAAAGGFTDVLLRHGASHVYAIDVGYGQLDWKLRQDSRVTVMERTNARALTEAHFPLRPSLTVMDVSFISIKLILPVMMGIMGGGGRFLSLIKPQFEAGRGQVGKNGVVREKKVHIQVIQGIRDFVSTQGWALQNIAYSPIKGPKGNIEFLADIVKEGSPVLDEAIQSLVDEAHSSLD